jgi:hypothetical protein
MLRKYFVTIVMAVFMAFFSGVLLNANEANENQTNEVEIKIDGEISGIVGIIEESRTLVPARAIAEILGPTVYWDGETRQVTIHDGDTTIILTIGSTTAYINGETTELDVPAQIRNGSTMVPLRFIAESLGVTIDFQDGMVLITTAAHPLVGIWLWDGYLNWHYVFNADGTGSRGILPDAMDDFTWHVDFNILYIEFAEFDENRTFKDSDILIEEWAFSYFEQSLILVSRQISAMVYGYIRAEDTTAEHLTGIWAWRGGLNNRIVFYEDGTGISGYWDSINHFNWRLDNGHVYLEISGGAIYDLFQDQYGELPELPEYLTFGVRVIGDMLILTISTASDIIPDISLIYERIPGIDERLVDNWIWDDDDHFTIVFHPTGIGYRNWWGGWDYFDWWTYEDILLLDIWAGPTVDDGLIAEEDWRFTISDDGNHVILESLDIEGMIFNYTRAQDEPEMSMEV